MSSPKKRSASTSPERVQNKKPCLHSQFDDEEDDELLNALMDKHEQDLASSSSDSSPILAKGGYPRIEDSDDDDDEEEEEEQKETEIPKEEKHEFSAGQERAFNFVKMGMSIMITGPAGTGKSHLIDAIVADSQPSTTFVTATTGIAALNVGGNTLHSFAGVGLGTDPVEKMAQKIKRKKDTLTRWLRCKRLIVDEASMLAPMLFAKLEKLARVLRRDNRPFGGIQVIFVGDFLQMPPVNRDSNAPSFCFQNTAWASVFQHTVVLSTIFRQKEDKFTKLLNEIRIGVISDEGKTLLESRVGAVLDTSDGVQPTHIFSRRFAVEDYNNRELDKLKTEPRTFTAQTEGKKYNIEALERSSTVPNSLVLKKGAQVLLCANLNIKLGLVNGARGVVKKFRLCMINELGEVMRCPVVRFTSGYTCVITPHTWETFSGGSVVARRTQVPFILGWAITAHKCQGMTLDKAVVGLSNVFEYGQAYVILSRAKSLEGLSISSLGLLRRTVKASPAAVAFYKDLEEKQK